MRGVHWNELPADVLAILRRGTVIPAHPLALDERRQFDRASQRALSRYYIDAGSGGLAVGVHATQFQIRDVGLYRPVLELAAETAHSTGRRRPLVMIAGVIGKTAQAQAEARTARALGLSRRAPGPQRHEGGQRGRADRPLQRRGGRDAADRLLPAGRRRRHPPVAQLLDALCRHRQRGRHQGGAIQSLRHAGCRLRRCRRGRRGTRHALHRQRRSHRGGPGDAAARARGRPRGDASLQGRAARPLERVDEVGRDVAGKAAGLRRQPVPYRKTSWPSTVRSPTATA